jgi:uncharacterized protein (DUF1697 family)
MPVYIALLRGINVGGNQRIQMERLRESCATLGFTEVQTYIQSGNVIFKANRISPASLAKKLEDRLLKDFGFPVPVVARTHEEMVQVLDNNPYLKEPAIDLEKLHVIFLPEKPGLPVLKELAGLARLPDRSRCLGSEIYLYLPNGFGHSSLANNPIERRLLHRATTRNWKTVTAIYQLCRDCA